MEKLQTINSKILIVGGGLTGCVAASLISQEALADVSIWEKENRIGGRMSSVCNPVEQSSLVDLGLQYVTTNLDFMKDHARFYDELLDENLLVPLGNKVENFKKLTECKTNFVAPNSSVSLVKHFLNLSDAQVCLKHDVVELNLNQETKQWEVRASNGVVELFDAVALTFPVPEVLKLNGNYLDLTAKDEGMKVAMDQVRYSCRFAVGVFYSRPQEVLDSYKWFAKYFPEDDIVRYMSIENRKRGHLNELPAVLIQSTEAFGDSHKDETDDVVVKMIMGRVKELIPDFPESAYLICKKWQNSQVIDAYIDRPGCLVLHTHPCLICGGDSFTESNFDGCLTSALRMVEELLKCVKISKGCKTQHKKSSPVQDEQNM